MEVGVEEFLGCLVGEERAEGSLVGVRTGQGGRKNTVEATRIRIDRNFIISICSINMLS